MPAKHADSVPILTVQTISIVPPKMRQKSSYEMQWKCNLAANQLELCVKINLFHLKMHKCEMSKAAWLLDGLCFDISERHVQCTLANVIHPYYLETLKHGINASARTAFRQLIILAQSSIDSPSEQHGCHYGTESVRSRGVWGSRNRATAAIGSIQHIEIEEEKEKEERTPSKFL